MDKSQHLEEEEFVEVTREAAEELPRGCLQAYVQQFSPGYERVYQDLAAQGKALVELFKTYPKEHPKSPESVYSPQTRRALGAGFVWHNMSRSQTEQGKGFGEGMFVFEDPDYRIHDFFAATATPRASTHFKGVRLTSYGMDIVQDHRTGLPGGHQTMHFGKRLTLDPKKQYTFMKPESWGTESLGQIAGHGGSYLLSLATHLLGYTTQVGQYKEHTPKSIRNAFLKLIQTIAPEERKPKIIQWGLTGAMDYLRSFVRKETPAILDWGVAGMVYFLRDFMKANPKTPHKNEIGEFVEVYLKNYTEMTIRQGEEVIIRMQVADKSATDIYQELTALLKAFPDQVIVAAPHNSERQLPPSEVDFKSPAA